MKRLIRSTLVLLALSTAASVSHAQVIRGRIREATAKTPVPNVEIRLLTENDSVVTYAFSTDSGTFVLKGIGPRRYSIDLRRIGFQQLTTAYVTLADKDTVVLQFDMERSETVGLDTVRVEERRSWWSSATPGKTWVQNHAKLGLGLFVAGSLIERSGLSFSEYLGRLEGLTLIGTTVRGYPMVPARNGLFLTSTFPSRCLYARIDRQSVAQYLIASQRESIDDLLKMNQIAAVEVYRDRTEIPEEWKDAGFVKELFYRKNGGVEYLLGHPGNSDLPDAMINGDAFGARSATRGLLTDNRHAINNTARPDMTQLVTRENISTPACGFLQIWTNSAW